MPRKKEKIVEAVVDDTNYDKSYFFPRVIAYLIDIVLVTLVVAILGTAIISKNEKYDYYKMEYDTLNEKLIKGEIKANEYINQAIDVLYEVDYNNVPLTIIEVVTIIGYFIIFQFYNKGRTLGKQIMKIKIISKDGKEPSINQLTIRALVNLSLLVSIVLLGYVLFGVKEYYFYVSMILDFIQSVIVITSVIFILFRNDGKGIHDLIANTKVVSS